MKRTVLTTVAAVFAAMLLNGCVFALGNSVPENQREAKGQPTLGKQLTDLRHAHDSGALTDDEYAVAKKRLIDGAEAKPAVR
ncbi:MAG TPA: hypothetical protein VK530_07500 [Candidatus Acidoferrum sp.]|nr:hypothetical protein [Candidatus Acidoferrum sp.]